MSTDLSQTLFSRTPNHTGDRGRALHELTHLKTLDKKEIREPTQYVDNERKAPPEMDD